MKRSPDLARYIVPALGAACLAGAVLVVSSLRISSAAASMGSPAPAEVRMPRELRPNNNVPTMEEVVAKHLFVPERVATGENAFPDLLVKGVYVGETQRNAVFSLKSKPEANLRIWQGDEDVALAQIQDERDPRSPIAHFLAEWHIQSIDFSGVTVEHVITGEVETYAVDYKPLKYAKSSAEAGYGQGYVVDTAPKASNPAGGAKPVAAGQAGPARAPEGGVGAIAGRVGQYMQNLTPEQRQRFLQQLQRQNEQVGGGGASSADGKNSNTAEKRKNGNDSSKGKNNGKNRR